MLNGDVISLVESRSECLTKILAMLAKVPSMAIVCPVVDYVMGCFQVTRIEPIKEYDGTVVNANVIANSGRKLPLDDLTWYSLRNIVTEMEKNINQ